MEGEKRKSEDCSSTDSDKRSIMVCDTSGKSNAANIIKKISALEFKLQYNVKAGVQGAKTIGQALLSSNSEPSVIERARWIFQKETKRL